MRLSARRTGARASATTCSSPIWSSAPTTSPARSPRRSRSDGVQLIGFSGLLPQRLRPARDGRACAPIPNVGAVLLVSLGCEEFHRSRLIEAIAGSGRPVELAGHPEARRHARHRRGRPRLGRARRSPRSPTRRACRSALADLVIGTKCGGSDGPSGITANPADRPRLRPAGRRRRDGDVRGDRRADRLRGAHGRPRRHAGARRARSWPRWPRPTATTRTSTMAASAAATSRGGLSTIEEKSLGAYAKSGTRPIVGLLKPGIAAAGPGLYLMDMVTDGAGALGLSPTSTTRRGHRDGRLRLPHVLFSTGRGSVVGSAIAPVIKVCANPETYRRMADDMDVDAGRILEGRGTLDEVGAEIVDRRRGAWPRRADQVGGARPPGVRADLQEFRAARARPASRAERHDGRANQRGNDDDSIRLAAAPGRHVAAAARSPGLLAAALAADKVTPAHQLAVLRLALDLLPRHRQGLLREGKASTSWSSRATARATPCGWSPTRTAPSPTARPRPAEPRGPGRADDLGRHHRRDRHRRGPGATRLRASRRSRTSRARRC